MPPFIVTLNINTGFKVLSIFSGIWVWIESYHYFLPEGQRLRSEDCSRRTTQTGAELAMKGEVLPRKTRWQGAPSETVAVPEDGVMLDTRSFVMKNELFPAKTGWQESSYEKAA
jgi:hypothetical protein